MATADFPVRKDQTVVSDGLVVGDMSTVGGMPTVTSELYHVPSDKVVFLVANSGNELSFVSSSETVTSQADIALQSRFAGAHSSSINHVGSTGLFATPAVEQIHTPRPVNEQSQMFRSTLEMQMLETRNMLTQQQVALNSLTDTLKAMQDDLKSRNEVVKIPEM